jgi:hypothetical protein
VRSGLYALTKVLSCYPCHILPGNAKINDTEFTKNMDNIIFGSCLFPYLDCLCGLLIRVPGYRSRGPGLIPGATRFSEK